MNQVERALAVDTDALRLPSGAEILPTEPALRADLRWCGEPTLGPENGLTARLAAGLSIDEANERAAADSVVRGIPLPSPRSRSAGSNVRVDVGEDLLDRLLAKWVVRGVVIGGLRAGLDASGLESEVQAPLLERIRWRVRSLTIERSPVLKPRADGCTEVALAGVALARHAPARTVERTAGLGETEALRLEPLGPRDAYAWRAL